VQEVLPGHMSKSQGATYRAKAHKKNITINVLGAMLVAFIASIASLMLKGVKATVESTRKSPFSFGFRSVPTLRATRIVYNVSIAAQMAIIALTEAMIATVRDPVYKPYFASYNATGYSTFDAADLIKASIVMVTSTNMYGAANDCSTMDNFACSGDTTVKAEAILSGLIPKEDEMETYALLKDSLERTSDSHFILRPTGAPAQYVHVNGRKSGELTTTLDNSIKSESMRRKIQEVTGVKCVTSKVLGDDIATVHMLSPAEAVTHMTNSVEIAKTCGQSMDKGALQGKLLHFLWVLYVGGQMSYRLSDPIGSEHYSPVTVVEAGEYVERIRKYSSRCGGGLYTDLMTSMVMTLTMKVKTVGGVVSQIKGASYVLPGGPLGTQPFGYAASDKMWSSIRTAGETQTFHQPRLPRSIDVGKRVYDADAKVTFTVGGVKLDSKGEDERVRTISSMTELTRGTLTDPERVVDYAISGYEGLAYTETVTRSAWIALGDFIVGKASQMHRFFMSKAMEDAGLGRKAPEGKMVTVPSIVFGTFKVVPKFSGFRILRREDGFELVDKHGSPKLHMTRRWHTRFSGSVVESTYLSMTGVTIEVPEVRHRLKMLAKSFEPKFRSDLSGETVLAAMVQQHKAKKPLEPLLRFFGFTDKEAKRLAVSLINSDVIEQYHNVERVSAYGGPPDSVEAADRTRLYEIMSCASPDLPKACPLESLTYESMVMLMASVIIADINYQTHFGNGVLVAEVPTFTVETIEQ